MTLEDIAKLRMWNQRISGPKFERPEEVVKYFGAIQAQDYLAALWAVGLRMKKAVEADIEKALADGSIIRMWPMRRTIHLVAAEDARWMHDLIVPRGINAMHSRGEKMYGLNSEVLERCRTVVRKALHGGKHLTRPALYALLEQEGIATKNSHGMHILVRLAHDGLICFGKREGKQATFTLVDEWIPKGKKFSREEALCELAVRYFTSHGPAQVPDLGWWSGLPMKDIRQGIELAGKRLRMEEVEGKKYYMTPKQPASKDVSGVYLLPAFDEFMVSYRDRSASLEAVHAEHINPGANGMLSPIVVVNGQIRGTWKRTIKKDTVSVSPKAFKKFTSDEKLGLPKAADAYGKFLKMKATVSQ